MMGRVDAVVADNGVILDYLKKLPKGKFKMVEDNSFEPESYGIMVKKGNKEVLDKINSGLKKIKEDGTFDKIYKKYFGQGFITGAEKPPFPSTVLADLKGSAFSSHAGRGVLYAGYRLVCRHRVQGNFIRGFFTTIELTVVGILFGTLIGLILGLMNISRIKVLTIPAKAYVDLLGERP